MNSSITITQIKYVLALHKEGTFSKAADKCFVTQSTLSTMIRKLEDQMQLKLFDRKSKPIKLTKEGQALITQFQFLHQEYENLQELIQEKSGEYYGTLKIAIIPTLAPFILPLFLTNMIENYPKVNFSIDEITTNEIIDRLKKRELDVGILSLPIGDTELVEKSLFYEDFLIYDVNRPSPVKKKKKIKIKEIDLNRLWLLCLLYTSPSPRDATLSRMPSSA